jgi:hypothetical protein
MRVGARRGGGERESERDFSLRVLVDGETTYAMVGWFKERRRRR